ncbi:SWIM zinc finger family protein [Komagataeibacter sp. AV436]|uniref:SWIM zinc finger family protein n=1 Tax=Komagataeibacter melomenusus TaxID=2766578 RepID=A0ABX2AE17_9PROT|nr:SWIM zinc finger family protein [Komagataeibacter melomenusus]MBV1830393.1 SWIM zinc finger domain-containing protein [Komagataeibacter melomenusus]NPC66097.1 SWIM zinc finger family protein [Komagataeibacter melomenusus]
MQIDPGIVEQLAVDQASLRAGLGLAKPAKWSGLGHSPDETLLWGECAGSGARPYRVMVDARDMGSKCTCPSRKFPCKHVLGLICLCAGHKAPFAPGAPPEWVGEWLARRRPKAATTPAVARPAGMAPDLEAARQARPNTPDDPKAEARREDAARKRAEETTQAVCCALGTLEQWIGDQLRLGLGSFVDNMPERCRQVAARLVDGKATALASRVDELPARILALPAGARLQASVVELGKLVQLACAFRAAPQRPDLRRLVCTAETRESVLAHPDTRSVHAVWEVLASQQHMQRDRLVVQTTWLLNLGDGGPRFAMLVDFFPKGAGVQRGGLFMPGAYFTGTVAFYPAPYLLRAILCEHAALQPDDPPPDWPAGEPPRATINAALLAAPWSLEVPLMLPAGRIMHDEAKHLWWRADDGSLTLPLAGDVPPVWLGTDLTRATGLWAHGRLTLLAARSAWGRLYHG